MFWALDLSHEKFHPENSDVQARIMSCNSFEDKNLCHTSGQCVVKATNMYSLHEQSVAELFQVVANINAGSSHTPDIVGNLQLSHNQDAIHRSCSRTFWSARAFKSIDM